MTKTLPTEAPQRSEPITHSLLVSEINQKYPQCRPVFEKYGIAGCGGEFGPQEPLFIFAAAHRVPLRELVDELNRALREHGVACVADAALVVLEVDGSMSVLKYDDVPDQARPQKRLKFLHRN